MSIFSFAFISGHSRFKLFEKPRIYANRRESTRMSVAFLFAFISGHSRFKNIDLGDKQ